MKKLTIMAACLLTLASCSKKASTTTTPTTQNNNQALPNSVTINVNSTSYTAEGNADSGNPSNKENIVYLITTKEDGKASLRLFAFSSIFSNSKLPFELDIATEEGNGTGVGTYDISFGDYEESFSGGEAYGDLTGTLTVTHNDNTKALGTFTITVSNSNGSKQLTGSFNMTDFFE